MNREQGEPVIIESFDATMVMADGRTYKISMWPRLQPPIFDDPSQLRVSLDSEADYRTMHDCTFGDTTFTLTVSGKGFRMELQP